MVKIAWSAGHGMDTAGKRTPNGEREWSFNNKVVTAGMIYLARYEGVLQLRVDDSSGTTDIPLTTRTEKANAWKADIYVSCHHNAFTGTWGDHGGVETYVMKPEENNPLSLKLANLIHPKVVNAIGLRDRGVKSANFHELRETNMPAILIEGGFMDSRTDIKKMRDDKYLKAHGEAIARGIVEYFNLNLKVVEKPLPEEILLEKAIVIGSIYDYASAERLAKHLKAPIYPPGVITGKVAKELFVVGGSAQGFIANKVLNLSGADYFETAANVKNYIG